MAHLIDKDALVAEIERRKNEEVDYDEDSKNFASYADHIHYSTLDSMEDFINTLEVKEVDLDKEMDKFYGIYRKNGITYDKSDNEVCFDWKDDELSEHEIRLAKYFFELGLKVMKGE